jgi:iron(III) transport system ATP-binding protein
MLRSIAGLEKPESGKITINERLVFSGADGINVPVHARHLGFVFQNYAIWPHMTVYENVEFPLAVARPKVPQSERQSRVAKALGLVGLESFSNRDGTLLSGGQQQRLALARAIVAEPEVLLLDEPLSNLDAKLRDEVRLELHQLQRRLGITTVFVTHDQTEAIALADTVAVMLGGKVRQIGSAEDVYERPADVEVAQFLGFANLYPGSWSSTDRFSIGPIELQVSAGLDNRAEAGSNAQYLAVRPEHVDVFPGGGTPPKDHDVISGVVLTNVYKGSVSEVRVEIAPGVVLQGRAQDGAGLKAGVRVECHIPHGTCHVLSGVPGVTIGDDASEATADLQPAAG